MFDLQKNCKEILLFFAIVVLWFLVNPNRNCEENFNGDLTKFVPYVEQTGGQEFTAIGEPKYDLRGYPIKSADANRMFMHATRQIRLTDTDGEMYISGTTPTEQGMQGCKTVACPKFGDAYNSTDICWKCSQPGGFLEKEDANLKAFQAYSTKFEAGCKPFAVDGVDINAVPTGWPSQGITPMCSR